MKITTTLIITLLIVFLCFETNAQRQWGLNDSTTYVINNDTTVIVSRKKLYLQQGGSQILVRDFTEPQNADLYIRDFDFFDARNWYVLVGNRYIGHNTLLFKTTNAGNTWVQDTSYYAQSNLQNNYPPSINQIQVTNDSTIFLFDGYYDSRVIYSTNNGASWTLWFQSLIAHYYGVFICGSDYYLYGLTGDGFPAFMFKIPNHLFGQQNVFDFYSGCHNGISEPQCIFEPDNAGTVPMIVSYFNLKADSICNSTLNSINTPTAYNKIIIYPNPAETVISVSGIKNTKEIETEIYNSVGKIVYKSNNCTDIDIQHLTLGLYFFKLRQENEIYIRTFIKK